MRWVCLWIRLVDDLSSHFISLFLLFKNLRWTPNLTRTVCQRRCIGRHFLLYFEQQERFLHALTCREDYPRKHLWTSSAPPRRPNCLCAELHKQAWGCTHRNISRCFRFWSFAVFLSCLNSLHLSAKLYWYFFPLGVHWYFHSGQHPYSEPRLWTLPVIVHFYIQNDSCCVSNSDQWL